MEKDIERKQRIEQLRKKKSQAIHQPDSFNGRTVEEQVKEFHEQVLEETQREREEVIDVEKLAPKKPNWDLKRDLEVKLRKLDRMTDAAIVELVRERLVKEGNVGEAAVQEIQSEDEMSD